MKLMSYAKYAQNLWDQNFMEICCITLEFNFNFPLKSFFFPNDSKSGNNDKLVPNQKS